MRRWDEHGTEETYAIAIDYLIKILLRFLIFRFTIQKYASKMAHLIYDM
jgi:hypothetical protein